jgi:hypothetical protein
MNGATEATLQELLAIAQSMNGNLIKLNSMFAGFQKAGGMGNASSGGSAPGALNSAATAASGFTKAINPASLALGVLQGAAIAVGKVLSVMADIVGSVIDGITKTIGALVKFSLQASLGEAKLSDFYKALSDVPLIGRLFSFFGDIVAMQERVLGSYQAVAKSGASFSGNLTDLQQAAARSYMSLDSFVATVAKSGDTFVLMSGNMQDGIRRFVDTQHKLMDPNGPYAQSIAGLGYTAEETATAMQSVIRSQGIMTGKNAMNNDQLAKATRDYMQDLDLLAKVTGKRRDQIQAEIDEQEADQAYQLFLDNITDPQEKEKIKAHVAQQTALYGKTGGEIAKNAVRGIMAPMNDAQTQFMTFNRGIMQVNELANKNIKDRNVSNEQFKNIVGNANYQSLKQSDAMFKSMGSVNTALASGMYPAINGIIGASRRAAASNFDYATATEKARKDQAEQQEGTAGALEMAENSIKGFGSAILGLISIVLKPLMEKLSSWGQEIQATGEALAKNLKEPTSRFAEFMSTVLLPKITKIGEWFASAFNKLMEAKPGEFWDNLGEILKDGFSNIWADVKPVIVAVWTEIKPIIVQMFKELFELMKEVLIGPKITKENQATYEKQNEINKSVMTGGERVSTFFAEFLEGFAGIFSEDFAKRMAADRIKSDTEYGIENKKLSDKQVVLPGVAPKDGKRHSGTWNMTGSPWEKKDADVTIAQGEGVFTQAQIQQLIQAGGGQNTAGGDMQQLNSLVAELIRITREQRDLNKQHLDATKSLNGNLFLA